MFRDTARASSDPTDHEINPAWTVFIGGSRDIATIPDDVARRIGNIIERRHHVVIGDAPGADTAVQRFMKAANYHQVTVFCSGRRCRNNLHDWPTRHITPSAHSRGFQFYAAKDRAMAHVADFGLMIWDGNSPGTQANAMRVSQTDKSVLLYNASSGQFVTIRGADEWSRFSASIHAAVLTALKCRITAEEQQPYFRPLSRDKTNGRQRPFVFTGRRRPIYHAGPGHEGPLHKKSTDRGPCKLCSHWKAPPEYEQQAYEHFRLGLSRRRVKQPTGTCDHVLMGNRTAFSATTAEFSCGNFQSTPPKPLARGGGFVTIWEGGRIVWQGAEENIPARFRQQELDL